MGRFKLSEVKEIYTEYPMYTAILKQYDTLAEGERELQSLNMRMRRLCQKNEKYAGISFYIVLSATKGDTAARKKVMTGQRGRPQFKVMGSSEKPHIHVIIYGKNCASFCQELRDRINKQRNGLVFQQKKCTQEKGGTNIIRYMHRQSYKIRRFGDLDFTQYFSEFYLDDYSA